MVFFHKKLPPSDDASLQPSENSPLIDLKLRIDNAQLPSIVQEKIVSEFDKLQKMDSLSADFPIAVNYIDFILSMPWLKSTKDNLSISHAEQVLQRHHHGLQLVKERILEFLAARTLKGKQKPHLLIVDDEPVSRQNLQYFFTEKKFNTQIAANGKEALECIKKNSRPFDIVITDLKMDVMDGITLLQHISRISPETEVIVVTGHATVSSAVDALRKGAAHYLTKPVQLDRLHTTVKDILENKNKMTISRGPVLCFTGPPGTAKTSIARAIASAIGKGFVRLYIAGLHDEAAIRGHRRTYVGAMPGRIVNEIHRVGAMNPCFLLDELDKIGKDFRGDPSSLFLEILDPEQNSTFTDHYLDLPLDLSGVMFIATVNDLSKLSTPLRDRLEIIEFPSYTDDEKRMIGKQYLIPKQILENGLEDIQPKLDDLCLQKIIDDYTRESGVRGLDREIGNIFRKIARTSLESDDQHHSPTISEETIASLLGPPKYRRDAAEGPDVAGVVTSLVWTEFGGEIMFIETLKMRGSNKLILTGSLGEILQESAQTALSYVRSHALQLNLQEDFFDNTDIHIHLPAGAVTKDGPSAGAAIAIALISLLTKRPACRQYAISGEMTLSGQLLPVGGLQEKILAAKRAGAIKVFLPSKNKEEVNALPANVTNSIAISFVDTIDELTELFFN